MQLIFLFWHFPKEKDEDRDSINDKFENYLSCIVSQNHGEAFNEHVDLLCTWPQEKGFSQVQKWCFQVDDDDEEDEDEDDDDDDDDDDDFISFHFYL